MTLDHAWAKSESGGRRQGRRRGSSSRRRRRVYDGQEREREKGSRMGSSNAIYVVTLGATPIGASSPGGRRQRQPAVALASCGSRSAALAGALEGRPGVPRDWDQPSALLPLTYPMRPGGRSSLGPGRLESDMYCMYVCRAAGAGLVVALDPPPLPSAGPWPRRSGHRPADAETPPGAGNAMRHVSALAMNRTRRGSRASFLPRPRASCPWEPWMGPGQQRASNSRHRTDDDIRARRL